MFVYRLLLFAGHKHKNGDENSKDTVMEMVNNRWKIGEGTVNNGEDKIEKW